MTTSLNSISAVSRAMVRHPWLAVALAALVSAAATVGAVSRGRLPAEPGRFAERIGPNEPRQLPVLFDAPDFRLLDQHGARFARSELLGHVWIADFIFTRCTSVCPMLTARMRQLQHQLAEPNLRFVSFSVDPEHDTPEALRQYAHDWATNEPRWQLLHTEFESLRSLADGMRVVAQPSGDPNNPILHTSLFFLVDRVGRVRGLYDSDDDRALSDLRSDAGSLSGEVAATHEAPVAAASGKTSFGQLGCAGCHDNAKLAPSLSGIWGQEVRLADGSKALVDESYVRQSIVAPKSQLVAGYLDSMPSYANDVSGYQLNAVVEYVHSLSATEPSASSATPAQTASIAKDPVCGMSVRVTLDTPHASRDGHEYYFCSDGCRTRFLAGANRNGAH